MLELSNEFHIQMVDSLRSTGS